MTSRQEAWVKPKVRPGSRATSPLNELFDAIYVINLPDCVERRQHMQAEMAKKEIRKFSFFEAFSHDSMFIREKERDGLIVPYRTCFVCRVNDCDHIAQMNRSEAGIWYTTLRLLEEMVCQGQRLCLVCEDDIVFHQQFVPELVNIFGANAQCEFNLDDPLIVGLFLNSHNFDKEKFASVEDCNLPGTHFRLESTRNQSNPCYVINRAYAKLVVDHSIAFDRPIDAQLFQHLPSLHRVQRWNVTPSLVGELSMYAGLFESTVPKNRDSSFAKGGQFWKPKPC